jgi:hypothetical protein
LQALFNKSIKKEFKMLIIYHEVDHSQVAEKYPLLADIKGIDSSVGLEKISQALFEAIGKQGQLSYLKHGFDRKEDELNEGFSISMSIGFPNFANQQFEKVLFDLGNKDVFHSRLRIIYYQNRIHFEVIDSDYHKISISADISDWSVGEQQFLHADFNPKEKKLFLFIGNQIVDQLSFNELSIDKTFLNSATGIIGNSLELRNPCQFLIGTHSIGKSMDVDMVSEFSKILNDYMNAIKK